MRGNPTCSSGVGSFELSSQGTPQKVLWVSAHLNGSAKPLAFSRIFEQKGNVWRCKNHPNPVFSAPAPSGVERARSSSRVPLRGALCALRPAVVTTSLGERRDSPRRGRIRRRFGVRSWILSEDRPSELASLLQSFDLGLSFQTSKACKSPKTR